MAKVKKPKKTLTKWDKKRYHRQYHLKRLLEDPEYNKKNNEKKKKKKEVERNPSQQERAKGVRPEKIRTLQIYEKRQKRAKKAIDKTFHPPLLSNYGKS